MSRNKKYQDTDKDRSRVWAFEVYPSSADPEWINYLAESMIHAYVSPLHDKDLNEDGTQKTPHYHVMLMYDTVQYPHQVIQDAVIIGGKGLGGCGILENYSDSEFVDVRSVDKYDRYWIGYDQNDKSFGCVLKCRSKSGMARYLCHMDNADKYRYNEDDVQIFGQPDYLDVCGSSYERYEVIKDMMNFCRDNQIVLYADLCDYAAEHHPCDWYKVLCDSGTYVMDRYLKSLRYKIVKDLTGE